MTDFRSRLYPSISVDHSPLSHPEWFLVGIEMSGGERMIVGSASLVKSELSIERVEAQAFNQFQPPEWRGLMQAIIGHCPGASETFRVARASSYDEGVHTMLKYWSIEEQVKAIKTARERYKK